MHNLCLDDGGHAVVVELVAVAQVCDVVWCLVNLPLFPAPTMVCI